MQRRSFIVFFCCFLLCIVLFMNYKMQRTSLYDTYAKQNCKNCKTKNKQTITINVNEKMSSFFDVKSNKDKSKGSFKHYIRDEYMFGNIKKVEDVVREARDEIDKLLRQHGYKDSKLSSRVSPTATSTTHTIRSTVSTEVTSSIPLSTQMQNVSNENTEINKEHVTIRKNDRDTVNNIRTDFKFANPSDGDLAKLTNEYIRLESVTDPLKFSSAVCDKKHFLLVVVISHPKSRERRGQIRNSWGYSYHDDVNLLSKVKKFHDGDFEIKDVFRMVFVMGKSSDQELMKSVYEEADNFKDIVFGDLVENYRNLTLKTRLALKWAYYDCQSTYVLKTDDDVFINPVPLVEWLKEKPKANFYTGYCNFNSPVIRDKRNRWYVSFEDYAETNYPGYCLGGGYLLSSDLVGAFLKASYGRKYFPMEDLYVGLLINEMKTVKIRDERKRFVLNYEPVKEDCKMNDLFLAHRVLGKQLQIHIERSRTALRKCQHNHW